MLAPDSKTAATPCIGDGIGDRNPKLALMGTTLIDPGYAEADQIADAVAFLASDESRFITAEHLSIDGGAQYF
jgi:NAD(P)-dependent dehydrogenase (short-subunit alcohol dehydrogenase family)